MRNTEFLDKPYVDDDKIGALQIDENGKEYRLINGEKIYQSDDEDLNIITNRCKASGITSWEMLSRQSR
jgi:hypothetical protein